MKSICPPTIPAMLALASLALGACAGPRMKVLDDGEFRRRPRNYPIDVFVGKVLESHREIAIIDSTGLPADDALSREKEIEELKRKARALGGDAVHDVRLLTKQVRGYTIDERVPFPSWKQGEYPLYFMRGVVIAYESGMPGAVSSGKGFTDTPEGFMPPGQRPADARGLMPEAEAGNEEEEAEGQAAPVREAEAPAGTPTVEIPDPPSEPRF